VAKASAGRQFGCRERPQSANEGKTTRESRSKYPVVVMVRVRVLVLPVAFTAALTVVKLLVPPLGVQLPFNLYFGAVLLSVLAGGRTAGAIASLLSAVMANVLFLEPPGSVSITPAAVLQTTTFLGEALTTVLLVDMIRAANARVDAIHRFTSGLSSALRPEQVAELVVREGSALLGASTGVLVRPRDAMTLEILASHGVPDRVVQRYAEFPIDEALPSAVAFRTGRPEWIDSPAEYERKYPTFAKVVGAGEPASGAASLPLVARGRTIGAVAFRFSRPTPFGARARRVLDVLAEQGAQALDRAMLHASEVEARTRLETTLRSIGDAVIATDTDGRITTINPVACELTGWNEEAALGKPLVEVFRIVNEATREKVESPVDKVLRDRVVVTLSNHTILLGKRPGMETPIDESRAPIRDAEGVVRGVVLVFRSASEAKRREMHRAFLAEASGAFASSLDADRTFSRVAELAVPRLADWCSIWIVEDGVLRQLAVAHVDSAKVGLVRDLGQRYPGNPAAPYGVGSVIRTGKSEFYPEMPDELLTRAAVDEEHLRLMLELHVRSALIVPFPGSSGVLGAITLVLAESERRYTVEDLVFAEDFGRRAAMAVENTRLYAAAERERERADTSNRAKDAFLATVSHELRTPLNAILGWSRILAGSEMPGPREVRALQVVERNAVAMAQLVEDLLDISRIISGQLRLDVQPTDVRTVVEAAVDALKLAAEARQVRIERRFDPNTGPILADPARIQQVIWNLVSNAVKFTPKGGSVRVSLQREDSNELLEVTDTGSGIDAAFLPHVFEPFRQADATFTRAQGGLGLGLAITRHLVQSDGLGKGSRFSVRLPHSTPRSDAPLPEPASHAIAPSIECPRELRGLRVLVVDDEEDARHLVGVILENCGTEVSLAGSVDEALRLFEQSPPHVLLSDIGMPGQDGFDLMRRLRALTEPKAEVLPAAALTAYARAEDRRAVLAAGFLMHIPKPVEPAELLAVVASLARYARRG
jgi:PAS domain S-box-containing protein